MNNAEISWRSEEIDKIMEKLFTIQGELFKNQFIKDQINNYLSDKGKKVAYVSLNRILNAVKDTCRKHNVFPSQPSYIEPMQTEFSTPVYTEFYDMDSGQHRTYALLLWPERKSTQGQGACYSYGKRYLLFGIFCIPTYDDDAEGAMNRPAKEEKKESARITKDQAAELRKMLLAKKFDKKGVQELLKPFKVDMIAQLPKDGYLPFKKVVENC
jgi:hypothetical protein